MADLIHVKTSGVAMQVLGPNDTGRYTLRLSASGESCEIDLGVPRGMIETALLMAASVKFRSAAIAAMPAQGVKEDIDALAYRFWSIHPKDIPEPVGMPEGYKGGKRAWFYANEMRRILAALAPAEAGGVEAKPVAWRQEDRCHPGWYYYGDAADEAIPDDAQLLYAAPAPVDALVKAAAQDAREVFEDYGSKAREAIDYMEQVALAAIREGRNG